MKWVVVADVDQRFLLVQIARRGPWNDCANLPAVVEAASQQRPIGLVLADAEFDSKRNHTYIRQQLGAQSVIPTKRGKKTWRRLYWRRVLIESLFRVAGCGRKNGAGGGTALLREGPEQQAAANFLRGVLDGRQAELSSLRPVVGDIVEILGIRAEVLEQGPLHFDEGEILLALIFFLPWFQRSMLPPDALHGHVA
ncbi:MAG: transposase [Candidatus Dormibacteria bacterium]